MKKIIKLTLLFVCSMSFAQTNLLDTSTWTVGTGSVTGFIHTGTDAENVREMGVGPHNSSVLLWKALSDAAEDNDGGWISDIIIDPSKTYRCTVWVKKSNSNEGTVYFGASAKDSSGDWAHNNLADIPQTYSSFCTVDLPTLDNWYLIVGYMHGYTYSGTTSIGGIYDGATANKVIDINDYKFQATAIELRNWPMLNRSTNPADSQYFYAPTIYEVNGQEPTIQELIDGFDTQVPTAPILSSTAQTDAIVDLSWAGATDDTVVTGYNIYKEGVLETTLGNVLIYQVTGLTAATSYDFTVTALDASSNESAVSNTVTITTETTSSGGGSGNWTLNNQDVYYNTGNVGIGTTIPDSKLTVVGTIHSEEVKVDLSIPAPDYVFETDYNLTPLEALQQYIKTYKHLPNIPSAKEMEANGVELGIMNMKLLEKIEELTLYILQQQNQLDRQNSENKKLKNTLVNLGKLIKNKKQ